MSLYSDNVSKTISKTDVLNTIDFDKTKTEIKETGSLDTQTTINILVRYLLGEDWYITDPVGGKQANVIILDTILRKYSRKYRRELRQEKNLENYANKLASKLERKKNKMKGRKSK